METQVGCLTQKSSQTIGVKPTVLDIMSRKVVTAYADSNVSNAIKLMVQKNIGSIVIKDNTGPVGIFTERDLIKNVLAKGIAPETQILMEVTPQAFNEIKEDQSLGDAARKMVSKKARLTVFEGDELVGIVTASDIVRAIYDNDIRFFVSDCIRKNVVVVDPQTQANEVIQIMNKKRIGSVLVGSGDDLGIFTERDMLRKLLSRRVPLSSPVKDFTTRPLITGAYGIGAFEVAQIMNKNRIKRLPLMRAGKVAGILTAIDLVKACALRVK